MWNFLTSFIPRAIMQGMPLLYGSTGEILTEKSGNLNLGVPGIMYLGGIAGLAASFFYEFNNPDPSPVVCLILSFTAAFLASALGGLLMLGTYASARADYGSQYILQSILIVVLGGIDPNGGHGKMSGVILAMVVLKMLESGINRFPSVSSYYISLIWGGVLLLSMVLDYFTADKRSRG